MSTVTDYKKCEQCGYTFGVFEFNCRTNEWEFDCLRCGYGESLQRVVGADGIWIGWKHVTLEGHGALWATPRPNGISISIGLRSSQEVEQAAQKMRAAIAKRELDPSSSYVTRWNSKLKRAEVAAGTWCQNGGGVFDSTPLDEPRFPVEMLSPGEESEEIKQEKPNVQLD